MSIRNIIIGAIGVALFLIIMLAIFRKEPRGALLFKSNDCIACHAINGKGGAAGPDLSSVGERRSREYIMKQIRDPKSLNPDTAMPSFARLPEKDINDLADYLSELK